MTQNVEVMNIDWCFTLIFIVHYWLLWIISALCHQNIFCYYWQSSHHSFKDENYAPADRVFTCLLLSSCEPRTSLDYPTITNSGERTCLPDVFKRRKCKGCPCHRPWCHGRCVFDRACYFAPCSDSPYKEDSYQTQWHWPHNKLYSCFRTVARLVPYRSWTWLKVVRIVKSSVLWAPRMLDANLVSRRNWLVTIHLNVSIFQVLDASTAPDLSC